MDPMPVLFQEFPCSCRMTGASGAGLSYLIQIRMSSPNKLPYGYWTCLSTCPWQTPFGVVPLANVAERRFVPNRFVLTHKLVCFPELSGSGAEEAPRSES